VTTRVGLALCAVLCADCGYRAGLRFPGEIRRVAVPVFGNETLRRGLEFDLTEAVARAFLERTDLEVTRESDADAVVRGRIREVRTPVLVEGGRFEFLEGAVVFEVEVELAGARDGATLARLELRDRAEFSIPAGEKPEGAFQESIDRMAERIVLGLAEKGSGGEPAATGR
jgi:hypothetical protein